MPQDFEIEDPFDPDFFEYDPDTSPYFLDESITIHEEAHEEITAFGVYIAIDVADELLMADTLERATVEAFEVVVVYREERRDFTLAEFLERLDLQISPDSPLSS